MFAIRREKGLNVTKSGSERWIGKKSGLILLLYLITVITVTSLHSLFFILAAQAIVIAITGSNFPRIAKKAAIAILLFNSIVTISYTAISLHRGDFSGYYVILINSRVFLLTTMTFLLADRINLFEALSFSRSLVYLLTLAYSQTLMFRRLFEDFRMAHKSRTLLRPSVGDLYRHGGTTGSYFIRKALHNASEITQAMKSRAFFDD